MIHPNCLSSFLGHDIVHVSRDNGTGTESWIECHNCHLDLGELDRMEAGCEEHKMRCIRCGSPTMQEWDKNVEAMDDDFPDNIQDDE